MEEICGRWWPTRRAFIEANYKTMSDEEMAKALGIKAVSVRLQRLKYGCFFVDYGE